MREKKYSKTLYLALSLVVAIVFWFYVDNEQGNTITESFSDIPVEYLGASDTLPSRGLLLTEGADATVDLTLSGPRAVISGLRRSDIVLQVDLTGVTSVGSYRLSYDLVPPDGVRRNDITIESASTSTVTAVVDEMFERTLPVDVHVTGEVADGYIYMSHMMVAEPSSITITGTEEDVDRVASISVALDLTDASSTVSREFTYQMLDSDGNLLDDENINVSSKRVMITAPLYVTKTLALTVKLNESPGSMSQNVDLDIDPPSIEVAGEFASLENKDNILLGEVNLSDYLSDTSVTMDIKLPADCINLSGVTSAEVKIDFEGLETRMFSVSDITAIGLAEDKSFNSVTNSVDVLVRGPKEELDQMTGEELRIVVNLDGYNSNGTHSVPATVLVDSYPNIGAVGSYTVTCKISS